MKSISNYLIWIVIALGSAICLATIALQRGDCLLYTSTGGENAEVPEAGAFVIDAAERGLQNQTA